MSPSATDPGGPPGRVIHRRLVIAGALHLDEVARPQTALVPGSSNPVGWTRRPGGVAANVAVAAAIYCAPDLPALVTLLGDDDTGRWLESTIRARGVQTCIQRLAGHSTGRYTAVLDHRGELHIGLADTALAEQLDWPTIATAIESLCRDDTQPGAITLVLDANLGEATWRTACNTLPAATYLVALPVSVAKAPRLRDCLARIDLLVLNRLEAAMLTGLATDSSPSALLDALSAAGTRDCVLTDGACAVTVQSDGKRCAIDVPPVTIATDVNGAGDALSGALLAGLLTGRTLPDAILDYALPAARDTLQGTTPATTPHADSRSPRHRSP